MVDVPGIVFMRGGAVAVLVILECEGKQHTILTYQARVPVGVHNLPEIPVRGSVPLPYSQTLSYSTNGFNVHGHCRAMK
jgi:hypothetical protein